MDGVILDMLMDWKDLDAKSLPQIKDAEKGA